MRKSFRYTLMAAAALTLTPAISSAATTDQAVKATAYAGFNVGACPAQPTRIRVGLVPVWASLKITTQKGVLVTGIGLMIRRYVGARHAVDQQPGVYSGCYALLTYRPGQVPRRLCITVKAGLTAPEGACQPVIHLPTGQMSVSFKVLSP